MAVKKARKKISKRKSLRRTDLYDAVKAKLIAEHDWDETGLKRSMIKDMVMAITSVVVENAVADRGVALPGLGKLTWKYRKAREAGTVTRFGQEMQVKARPASWVPRFRLQRSAKVALLEAVPEA